MSLRFCTFSLFLPLGFVFSTANIHRIPWVNIKQGGRWQTNPLMAGEEALDESFCSFFSSIFSISVVNVSISTAIFSRSQANKLGWWCGPGIEIIIETLLSMGWLGWMFIVFLSFLPFLSLSSLPVVMTDEFSLWANIKQGGRQWNKSKTTMQWSAMEKKTALFIPSVSAWLTAPILGYRPWSVSLIFDWVCFFFGCLFIVHQFKACSH